MLNYLTLNFGCQLVGEQIAAATAILLPLAWRLFAG